jgi:WD40 repeat protein
MAKLECVTDQDLKAFLLGNLPERVADTIARHLESCADCLQRASRWDDVTDGAVQALRRSGNQEPPATSIGSGNKPKEPGTPEVSIREMSAPAGFTLLEELGRGAAGIVFKARQLFPERVVALKFLVTGTHPAEQRARFLAEANVIARLNHPHIVQVHSVGEHQDRPFLCLEYIAGDHLGKQIRGRPQPPGEAAVLLELLARAVQHAHENGIVHRDLKPANVLLSTDGTPKVTDFGLARFGTADLTATGAVLGTPAYMSPEQARGDNAAVGPGSDVWALGAILYELLTGQPPFRGVQALDTLKLVTEQEPVSAARLQPGVPRDLDIICLKCLEKSPGKRYPSAGALADDLKRFREGLPIKARPVSLAGRIRRWCRRKPALALAGILAITGVLATIVLSVWFALFQYQSRTELDQANSDLSRKRKELEAALCQSRLDSARLAKERGLALCRQGDVNAGMLWLAEALRLAPREAEDLQTVIRAQLAQWSPKVTPMRLALVHPQKVTALAFAPDGKSIYTGCADAKFRRWDAHTGKLLYESTPLDNWWVRITPSTDGKFLRVWTQKESRDLDAATGEIFPKKQGEFREVTGENFALLMISANGKTTVHIPVPNPPNFRHGLIITEAAGKQRQVPLKSARAELCQALSRDGRFVLIFSLPGGFRVRSCDTGAMVGLPLPLWDTFTKTIFHPNNSALFIADAHHQARVWSIHDGKWISPPLVHPATITDLAFSPDGKQLLTACADGTVRLWDWQPPAKPMRVLKIPDVLSIAFSRDTRRTFLGSPWKSGSQLCETATGKKLISLPHDRDFSGLAMTADGQILATITNTGKKGEPGKVTLWNADTGKPCGPVLVHPLAVSGLAFSPDGKTLATLCGDGKIRFWQTATGTQAGTVFEQPGSGRLAYSPDGRLLLTGCGDKFARLWDLEKSQLLAKFPHPNLIYALAVAPGGKLILIGGHDRTARLWNVATAKPIGPPLTHPQVVGAVAFSPDGHMAVTGGDGKVQLWEAATGQQIGPTADLFRYTVRAIAFAPDGQSLVIGARYAISFSSIPLTMPGEPKAITLSVQALTGLELNPDREIQALDGKTRNERCGRPLP